MQINIENIGYMPEMTELTKCIDYICKQTAAFWFQYRRKKASILEFKSKWLSEKETISIKRIRCKSQEMVKSAQRGHPKVHFNESSKRTKRRKNC